MLVIVRATLLFFFRPSFFSLLKRCLAFSFSGFDFVVGDQSTGRFPATCGFCLFFRYFASLAVVVARPPFESSYHYCAHTCFCFWLCYFFLSMCFVFVFHFYPYPRTTVGFFYASMLRVVSMKNLMPV